MSVAIAAMLGALTVAGFAPLALAPLPLLTLAGLLILWRRAANPRDAFLLGFSFGCGLFGAGVSWVYISLHDFGQMPATLALVATVAFCAILALYPAAAGWCCSRLDFDRRSDALVAFPAAWTAFEWLRGWLLSGVPWLSLGYTQVDSPLAGVGPVLGTYGVSFLTVFCAGLVQVAVVRSGRVRLLCAVGLLLVLSVGQVLKLVDWTRPVGTPTSVSLLQGDIPQDLKFNPDRYAGILATYRRLIDSSGAQLVVLPETAIPRFLDLVDPSYLQDIAVRASRRGADVLIGVPIRDARGRYFNSLISIGASPAQRYDKSHLVPFGEYIPPSFGWIVKTLAIPLADFSSGPAKQSPLAVGGQRVAANICWEDAFGEEIIRQLPDATLLVNVSNVAWFGDSLAPAQHLQISRMRAIETGRYMLRATNTGVTAIVDAHGVIVARLPLFTEGALTGQALGYTGATPYVRFGNVPVVLLALTRLGTLWLRRRIVGRREESQ